jgi:phosphatidylglycerophosphatase A
VRSTTPAPLPARLIATGCGLGYLPWMPGTWASLATVAVAWPIAQLSGSLGLIVAFVLSLGAGIWAAGVTAAASDEPDPGSIVIDEVAGQFAALATLPADALHYAAAFVAFRLADIWKPWPASWADRRLPGGLGVMIDDVFAAVYAAAAVHVVSQAWKSAI